MKFDSMVVKEPSVKKTIKAKKKTKAKKKSLVENPIDIRREVAEENCFWVLNGPSLKSLSDLCEELPRMNDEQFDHHTKRDGNDFAKWIAEVFQEEKLAKKVARLKTRESIILAIEKSGRN
jgi:hypothetical protein